MSDREGALRAREDGYRRAGYWTGKRLHELVKPSVASSPSLIIANGESSTTLLALWQDAQNLAAQLAQAGIGAGDPVLVVVTGRPSDVSVLLALSMLDAVTCLAPPGNSTEGIETAVQRTSCRVAVAGPESPVPAAWFVERGVQLMTLGADHALHPAAVPYALPAAVRPPGLDRAQFVSFTSGSTGNPKAVLHTADTMSYAARLSVERSGAGPGAVLGLVAMSHAAGLAFSVFASLPQGRDLVLYDGRWDPSRAFRLIEQYGAVWSLSVPTHLVDMINRAERDGWHAPAPGFLFSCGGAPVPGSAVRRGEAHGISVVRMFGLSECLGHTSMSVDDDLDDRATYDGRVFPGSEVVALDASGHVLARNSVGEGGCRGPALFRGYLEQESPLDSLNADGYFATGDLLEIDDDDRVRVVSRVKDIIIRGGENVDPQQVESDVLKHPSVTDVAVVGYPDNRLGERIAAWVVTDAPRLDRDQLAEFLMARGVPRLRFPDRVTAVDALPRNPIGKIDKKALKAMHVEGS